jgi:hypothetical protein
MAYLKHIVVVSLALVAVIALADSADRIKALAQTKEPSRFPSGIKGLAEVVEQIAPVFDAHRDADQAVANAECHKIFF